MASSLLLLQLHHLVFKPLPSSSSSSSLFIKPLATTFIQKSLQTIFNSPHSSLPPSRLHFFCNSSSSPSSSLTYPRTLSSSPSLLLLQEDNNSDLDSKEGEIKQHIEFQQTEEPESELSVKAVSVDKSVEKLPVPVLTVKEKKELAAYAHSLGKKLKSQQVGKSGVTSSVAASFVENLESNELLKLKIHNSCPGELPDVIKQLEEETGSVAVGQIGRSVILYRPSLTKLKAEEKKKQAQRVIARKTFRVKPTEFKVKPANFREKPAEFREKPDEQMQKRVPSPRLSSRGRRGRSRFELP